MWSELIGGGLYWGRGCYGGLDTRGAKLGYLRGEMAVLARWEVLGSVQTLHKHPLGIGGLWKGGLWVGGMG